MSEKLSYTNRCGNTAYIRVVSTNKGGLRYYITKDPKSPDLLEEMPSGFEFYEHPYDARIVFRKRVIAKITETERQIVESAMFALSDVKDFKVISEGHNLVIYISQFSSIAGQEPNLSAEETRQQWGGIDADRFKRYDDYVRFVLVNESKRTFRLERKVFMGLFGHDYAEIKNFGRFGIFSRNGLPTHWLQYFF